MCAAPSGSGSHCGTGGKCDSLPNWHMALTTCGCRIAEQSKAFMEQPKKNSKPPPRSIVMNADWAELERRGLILPSPGREEAVRATLDKVAAKKAAEHAKVNSPTKSK